jgi:hypothetical protein
MPDTLRSLTTYATTRKEATWKMRVAMTTAMTETPPNRARKSGRTRTFSTASTSAAMSSVPMIGAPGVRSKPGVSATAPPRERTLMISVDSRRRTRVLPLGCQFRMTWIWSR